MTPSSFTIIYEDNHLFVVNKPSGMLTQAAGGVSDSLEEYAKAWLKEINQKPGRVYLETIHRLDRPVSGIVVFAKTSKALSRLNESMRAKGMRKVYWGWVEGEIANEEGVLEDTLIHDEFRARVVAEDFPGGKKARLKYSVLQRKRGKTLCEIEIETGRYHQIRIQFSHAGYPIVGDLKYGAKERYAPDSIALHHIRLELHHPVTKERLIFSSPLPLAFERL